MCDISILFTEPKKASLADKILDNIAAALATICIVIWKAVKFIWNLDKRLDAVLTK